MVVYYVGILDGSKDVWGVRIPDVRGCYGGGATPEAAIADATSALREFAAHQASKGIALNPPRSPQAVKADPVAEFDAGAGESFVMVPLILDHARPVKANISLDAGELEAIDQAAEARGLTRSAFVTSAALSKIVEVDEETAKLRTKIAAAHEQLARQSKHFVEEMLKSGIDVRRPGKIRLVRKKGGLRQLIDRVLTTKHPVLTEEEIRQLAASALSASQPGMKGKSSRLVASAKGQAKGPQGSRSRSKSSA